MSNKIDKKKVNRFKDFETLYTEEKSFNAIIKPNKNLNLLLHQLPSLVYHFCICQTILGLSMLFYRIPYVSLEKKI